MSSYKQTLVVFIVFSVIVIIGTCVFTAIEKISYEDSFALSMQMVTTVGYGNVPPKTNSGKIFCIFFCWAGIPANVILLQKIGEHMLNMQKFGIFKIEKKLLKTEPKHLAEKSFVICLLGIWSLILIGAALQTLSGWSFLDGVYCFFITFTTIGFGDLVPGEALQPKKVYSVVLWPFYSYLGLCVMANLLNSVVDIAIRSPLLKKFRKEVNDTNANVNIELQE